MKMKSDGKIQEQQDHVQPLEPQAVASSALGGDAVRAIVVVAAIVVVDGKVLLTQRPANVHLPNVWEFPGGKVESGESLEAALRRELREELGIDTEIFDECFSTTHHYPEKSVELHFFNCAIVDGEPRAIEVADVQWARLSELRSWKFPEADRELIDLLVGPDLSL